VSDVSKSAEEEPASAADGAPAALADAQVAGGDLLRIGRERGCHAAAPPGGLLASPEAYAIR